MAKQRSKKEDGLRSVQWKKQLRAPDAELLDDLYVPALSRAVRYDRCCAYFSSSVLAVAARGFGGFIQNLLVLGDRAPRPAARLIVNEELDRNDVEALLATGDDTVLSNKLLKELKNPKDALEKNRLQMLAWLVAEGLLEVRVGTMRSGHGIVHAKFGIITDHNNDCLAFLGSDNETGAAIAENYEELVLFPSWLDNGYTDRYCEQFDLLWEDKDTYVETLALPDAVKAKLIKFAPKDPPRELLQDTEGLKTAMLFQFLPAAPYLPDGEYACDATAPVDVWVHQRRVVDDTAKAFPAGRLLCDEVGLGKTIEAILVLRRLLSGRGVKRALLLVPAGLLQQWQDELREKGGLLVSRWENGNLIHSNGERQSIGVAQALAQNDVLLLSREWARLKANRDAVLHAPQWDLVLLDEAHVARRAQPEEGGFNSGNLLFHLLRELQLRRRARGILLLSATPMQTQPWEPWDLLSVLGVGGAWMVEFEDIRRYYDGVEEIKNGTPDPDTVEAIARLVVRDDEFPTPPNGIPMNDSAELANGITFSFGEEQRKYAEWLRRGAPLGRQMHRNTRDTLRKYHAQGLLKYPMPRRDVEDKVFDYNSADERVCYNAIDDYMNRRFEQLEQEQQGKGFVMTIYRRRMASSPRALHRSLTRRLELCDQVIHRHHHETWLNLEDMEFDTRDLLSDDDLDTEISAAAPADPKSAQNEKKEIESLLQKLDGLGEIDSKFDTFWETLRSISADGRSVLVFTEYADTMEYLRDNLLDTYGRTLGCFSGAGGQIWDGKEWVKVSKADITERLTNAELTVLVCTDAASEGLNLQAASALINYDLPWNPSKVEQRIGRIDRIGQSQPTLPIRNMFLTDSVDMTVYAALRERCGLFEHFVGPMQPVLALARDALRQNLPLEKLDVFLGKLEQKTDTITGDSAVENVFIASDHEVQPDVDPPVTRQDMEMALNRLVKNNSQVKAKQVKGKHSWRLSGLGKRYAQVTTVREVLEFDQHAVPLTVCSEVLQRIRDKLKVPSQVPLVIETFESDAYQSTEARWIQNDRSTVVSTVAQLMKLMDAWDGTLASAGTIMKVRDRARADAKRRVQDIQQAAGAAEKKNSLLQIEAARLRLLRELGRTLHCISSTDLTAQLYELVKHDERDPDGRFSRAWKLLDGNPTWTQDEVSEINSYVGSLNAGQRDARRIWNEVDAALNDPRWQARKF